MTSCLEDVQPDHSASFSITPQGSETQMHLEVLFQPASNGGFEVAYQRWHKMESSTAAQNSLTLQWRGRMPLAAGVMDLRRHVDLSTQNNGVADAH